MAFVATITLNSWKSVRCFACGGTYHFKLNLQVQGRGESEAEAKATAERNAERRASAIARPCPHCGAIQPESNGKAASQSQIAGSLGCGVVCAVVLALAFGRPLWLNYTVTIPIVGLLSAVALRGLFIGARNPNSNPQANLAHARELVAADELRPFENPRERLVGPIPSFRPRFATFWLVVGLLGFALVWTPLVLKITSGWDSNSDLKPEVAGPGDTIEVLVDGGVQAVAGPEAIFPRGTLTDMFGKVYPLQGVDHNGNWGDKISTKGGGKPFRLDLFSELVLPTDPALAWQTVTLDLEIAFRYPSATGPTTFEIRRKVATQRRELKLSSPRSKRTYDLSYAGAFLGVALLAVSGVMLSRVPKVAEILHPNMPDIPASGQDQPIAS